MRTDWTVERLNALPEGTVIGYSMNLITRSKDMNVRLHKFEGGWVNPGGIRVIPKDILDFADAGSLHVVSVPIDALLADETVDIAQREAWVSDSEGWSVRHGIRAAVAHVTGEARP